MSRQELASLDVLGSDEELSAARGGSPARDLRPEFEGRDVSQAVAVRVDRCGHVTDVLISQWWREELTPAGLRDGLLTAYQAAYTEAAAAIDPTDTYGRSSAALSELPPDVPDEPDDVAWLETIRRRLDRAQQTLEHTARLLQGGVPPERSVPGPAGLVRLVVRGGTVSGVLIDARVATRESPSRLAADALAAFQAVA